MREIAGAHGRAVGGARRPSRRSAPTISTAGTSRASCFTENESNAQRLWDVPNATPYVKDAFHRCVVDGDEAAVNPEHTGTKFAAWHELSVEPASP